MWIRRGLQTALTIAFLMPVAGISQSAQSDTCHDHPGANCNGISVGRPKIFDNRSLTLRLEALQKSLQTQQNSNGTFDLKTVMAALSNIQGLSQSDLETAISVLANPTPGITRTTDVKTGNVDSSGNPLPNTTDTQTQLSKSSVTPTAPTLDSFGTLPAGFNPNFGSSASDLLNDQVNLSYQIINLQMILERALSDRLDPARAKFAPDGAADKFDNRTRLQAVLGFNVTIDPPRTANDAVAVVEIRLKRQGRQTNDQDISLVALMPQEKAYNAAALSTKSNAYGGSAVVGAFQMGAALKKRNQTFYVYKDTDTLSYQRMDANGDLIFGWMFRPVLGRRSVSPGIRQMLAVVAMPNLDCDEQQETSVGSDACTFHLDPTVRTYWKKYDRGTQTSYDAGGANRAREFWMNLSLGLARPQIFTGPDNVNTVSYPTLDVYSSWRYEAQLRPAVCQAEWHPTGEKTAIVSVKGNNFFTDTQVKFGDSTFTEANKTLLIKSNQGIDFLTTTDQLANGPGSILGRYGLSVPIILPKHDLNSGACSASDKLAPLGYKISGVAVGPALSGSRRLEVTLEQRLSDTDEAALEQSRAAVAAAKKDADETARHMDAAKKALADKKLKPGLQTVYDNAVNANQAAVVTYNAAYAQYQAHASKTTLEPHQLPQFKTAGLSATGGNSILQSPIVSVNGHALTMPYEVYAAQSITPGAGPGAKAVKIVANFDDKLLSNGAALIKVTWPFYNAENWTATQEYTDPDSQFKVERVSKATIVISRQGGPSFDSIKGQPCWMLVAGDKSMPLATALCVPSQTPPPTISGLPYIASFTAGKDQTLPSSALLLAPDGSAYHLVIPDLATGAKKDDAAKPIALKQYDSAWIKIAIPPGKTVDRVEANGGSLNKRPFKKPDAAAATPGGEGADSAIEVEVTRNLTMKSGTIDITVLDKSNQKIASQQVAIACSECQAKGEK